MFDPRNPFERVYWHYDSRKPLSLAQLIHFGSVDAHTAALIWLMLEQGTSFIVAGPTDPKPGVGKTTVLNALFQLLPEGSALAYTAGMYEDFAFMTTPGIEPEKTYVLCNEVSDHQPFYMWGRVARYYLQLPSKGYRIATSMHADTIDDAITQLHYDLRLSADEIRRLGLVIHIEVLDWETNPLRRWITTHFIKPEPDPERPGTIIPVPLSVWDEKSDTFEHADQDVLDKVAEWLNMSPRVFNLMLKRRIEYLQELSQRPDMNMDRMFEAIKELQEREQHETLRL